MLISYTKEAEFYFEDELPFTATKEIAREFAQRNDLYTWYATCLEADEEEIILFVNGKTGFPIMLPESATLNIQEEFMVTLSETLQNLGVEENQILTYFENFPEFVTIEYIPGMVGNYLEQYLSYFLEVEDVNEYLSSISSENENELAASIENGVLSKIFDSSVTLIKEIFEAEIPPVQPISRMKLFENDEDVDLKDELDIRKDYRQFLVLEENPSEAEELLKEYDIVTKKVLEAFENYLQKEEKDSEKVVKRDLENINRFLGEELKEEEIGTPIFSMEELFGAHVYLKSRESLSEEKIKGLTQSLQHFYKFLYEKNAITKEEWEEAKEIIPKGEELVYMAIDYDDFLE